jgi:hypothetical protein
MRLLGRIVVLMLSLGVLYSGPVAACVCADEMPPSMPCCPDDPLDSGHSDFGLPGTVATACDPAPADLLPAGSFELSPPVAISSAAPPPWQTHAPPPALAPPTPVAGTARPIYLVTLRLRN